MREIEANTEIFVNKLDAIMQAVEENPSGLTVHTLFQHSNNKLKIEIESKDEEKRRLIYIFYNNGQQVFRSMDIAMGPSELRLLLELVKRTFREAQMVRNAHIRSKSELYYFVCSTAGGWGMAG